MKKPMQQMGLERQMGSKVDTERWGPAGRELIMKLDGMRERMREASQSYSERGAEDVREVMGRYQALVYQGGIVCQGFNMRQLELGFKWADAFDASATSLEYDWDYERTCVIFNLAGSISFLATHSDRQTPEGLKAACGLYQQAAGALHAVHELVKAASWRASADLSGDTLGALEALMLAQAQKCFFEKAEGDGMTPKVLAMLSAECAALYEDVGIRVEEAKRRSRPISSMSDDWLDVVQWNRLLFDALQHFHLATLHREKSEFGNELSRLTYACDKSAMAVNACANANPALQELFKRHYAICKEAHTRAKHDNELVHYAKVPDIKTLPKPERKCMVRSTSPPEILNLEEPKAAAAAPGRGADPPPSFAVAETAGVAELVGMGFTEEAARDALDQCGGSVQAAAELLLQRS